MTQRMCGNEETRDHPLIGTTHTVRNAPEAGRQLTNDDHGVTPGLSVEIVGVFQNWNQVAGLDMLYVWVPANKVHVHLQPAELGLPPLS
ncbi:hypothetical protein MUG78_17845 [Gordonia alkaliphila]|uniref:hypothetical protein n=1 Tax=Gordonia alkaliphila TaxID=1053547 RepID=UPI001FF66B2E|nr:hypothetical protein [Gordonia alkaliphila]MCK0441265.1 hypothetical protein [Gordonia alkaliphila]